MAKRKKPTLKFQRMLGNKRKIYRLNPKMQGKPESVFGKLKTVSKNHISISFLEICPDSPKENVKFERGLKEETQ